MENFRKNIAHMFFLLLGLFVAMALWFVWLANDDVAAHPFNARVNMEGAGLRGSIYDAQGLLLAYSDENGRHYPLGAHFAHVVGYSGMSRAGLELSQNFVLERLSRELWQMAAAVIFDDEVRGNSIHTTLNADVQSFLYNGMGGSRGAAVVLDVQTGGIVTMLSTPSFDPNRVTEDWSTLLADGASPLLNRASQGLYPPGSTFKLITALAAIEYDVSLLDFEMHCTGVAHFDGETLQCFGGNAHGYVDFMRAMALSCNAYFASLAQMIDLEYLINAAENAGLFNQSPNVDFPAAMPLFAMQADASIDELIQTAIGQGRTLANPLNMVLFTAAIANDGALMEPYLLASSVGAFGNVISTASPRSIGRLMTAEAAEILRLSMIQTVQAGTGTPAAQAHVQVAGKTGTAQNETGMDHSWFVGFAPADEPRYAIAIIIEGTGGGTRATQLAGNALGRLLQ